MSVQSQRSEVRSISSLNTDSSRGITRLNKVLATYAAIEFFAVASAAFLGGFFYHYFTFQIGLVNFRYILAATTIATLTLVASVGLHTFSSFQTQPRHVFVWKGLGAVALAFSAFLTMLFFAQAAEAYSRGSLIFQIVSVSVAIVSARSFFYSWLQNATSMNRIEARRVALVGDISHCLRFVDRLKLSGIKTVGFFRLPTSADIATTDVPAQTIRGLVSDVRPHRVDDIILLATNEIMPAIFKFASLLAELPAGIHVVPIDAPNALASSQIANFGNLQTLQIHRPPLSMFDLCLKRALDIVLAAIGLIVLSPLFFIISIAVKLDSPGPVFFRNTRHGFNNEEIRVFKFRSMTSIEDGAQFTQAT